MKNKIKNTIREMKKNVTELWNHGTMESWSSVEENFELQQRVQE